jgi:uncharacterized protein
MRLFSGKIPTIAEEIVIELSSDGGIEVESRAEVQQDLEAVLKEYLRSERDVVDEAKNRLEARGMTYAQLSKIRQQVAKERGFPETDDTLPYIIDQLLNMLFHSANVAEVFAEDADIRRKMTKILKRHMDVESELDIEVRSKIKNLSEGTASFEIEYARVLDQIKRKKGLS